MKLAALGQKLADRAASCFGYRLIPQSLLDLYQIDDSVSPVAEKPETGPAADAAVYMRRDNPRLLEIRRLYAGLDPALQSPQLWTEEYTSQTDLGSFPRP